MVLEFTPGGGFGLSPKRFSHFATKHNIKTVESPTGGVMYYHDSPADTPTNKEFNLQSNIFENSTSYFHDEPDPVTRKQKYKGRLFHFFSISLGVLWLVPACILVYINLSSLIIGAAAWCPGGYCPIISYFPPVPGAEDRALKYDQYNHNLLGALQFAAKAIEVWFMFIATSLIYTVTCMLAKKEGGLPIGYLLTHLEFMDLRVLFNPVLWFAPQDRRVKHADGRAHTTHLYVFAVLTTFMCVIANLIGPSIAVLLIPTLQWVDTPQVPGPMFNGILSSTPPLGDGAIPGCNGNQLSAGLYNCTAWAYQSSLDAMADSSSAAIRQADLTQATQSIVNSGPPATLEGSLAFAFNVTYSASPNKLDTYWAPSRTTMRELSADFNQLADTIFGIPVDNTYVPYNNSLSLVMQRQGPVIGLQHYLGYSNLSITTVDSQREVRCYNNFAVDSASEPVTKCFRKGNGWNSTNSDAEFTIDRNSSTNYEVLTTAYWADKTTYFTGNLPQCLQNGTLPPNLPCDWDSIFNSQDPPILEDRAEDVFVLEYSLPTSPMPETVLIAEVFPSLGFATYSVDVSKIFPTLPNAMIANPPSLDQTLPVVLNADWVLAAWSTNQFGDVGTYRASAYELQKSIVNVQLGVMNGTGYDAMSGNDDLLQWYYLTVYTSLQASSMVNYNTSTPTSAPFAIPTQADPNHPILWTNLRRQVWMYGIDSRTSKLGLVVILIGIASVLARTILVAWSRVKKRSAVELLVTALEHTPQHEFEHTHKELEKARVRFKMLEHHGNERVALMPLL